MRHFYFYLEFRTYFDHFDTPSSLIKSQRTPAEFGPPASYLRSMRCIRHLPVQKWTRQSRLQLGSKLKVLCFKSIRVLKLKIFSKGLYLTFFQKVRAFGIVNGLLYCLVNRHRRLQAFHKPTKPNQTKQPFPFRKHPFARAEYLFKVKFWSRNWIKLLIPNIEFHKMNCKLAKYIFWSRFQVTISRIVGHDYFEERKENNSQK